MTPHLIMTKVCTAFGLSQKELMSKSRRSEIVLARQTGFYIARKYTPMTLESIGRMFNRHHSSVIHGIQAIDDLLVTSRAYKKMLNGIMDSVPKRMMCRHVEKTSLRPIVFK